jgi:hypothetical protein
VIPSFQDEHSDEHIPTHHLDSGSDMQYGQYGAPSGRAVARWHFSGWTKGNAAI